MKASQHLTHVAYYLNINIYNSNKSKITYFLCTLLHNQSHQVTLFNFLAVRLPDWIVGPYWIGFNFVNPNPD